MAVTSSANRTNPAPDACSAAVWVAISNARCRDECLNMNQFDDLIEAKITITDWKINYNKRHRHSKLRYLTPLEYADQCKCTHRLSNDVDH